MPPPPGTDTAAPVPNAYVQYPQYLSSQQMQGQQAMASAPWSTTTQAAAATPGVPVQSWGNWRGTNASYYTAQQQQPPAQATPAQAASKSSQPTDNMQLKPRGPHSQNKAQSTSQSSQWHYQPAQQQPQQFVSSSSSSATPSYASAVSSSTAGGVTSQVGTSSGSASTTESRRRLLWRSCFLYFTSTVHIGCRVTSYGYN